jgi:hypothetical protein
MAVAVQGRRRHGHARCVRVCHPRAFHILTEAYPAFPSSCCIRWRDGREETPDVSPSVLDGAVLCGAHSVFDFGESLLDRIEVG